MVETAAHLMAYLFQTASAIDATAMAQAQTDLHRRILRAFVCRGLLETCDAKDMLAYQYSGFTMDACVCIQAHDRAAPKRLLRYCARPPFAMDRLRKEGAPLVPPPRTHRHRFLVYWHRTRRSGVRRWR